MKKYLSLIAVALIAIFTLGLSSCDKEKNEPAKEASIVGTWKVVKPVNTGDFQLLYVQFRADGVAFTFILDEMPAYPERKVLVARASYERSGNLITAKAGNSTEQSKIHTLTSDKLILEWVKEKADDKEEIIIECVRVPDSEVAKYLKDK